MKKYSGLLILLMALTGFFILKQTRIAYACNPGATQPEEHTVKYEANTFPDYPSEEQANAPQDIKDALQAAINGKSGGGGGGCGPNWLYGHSWFNPNYLDPGVSTTTLYNDVTLPCKFSSNVINNVTESAGGTYLSDPSNSWQKIPGSDGIMTFASTGTDKYNYTFNSLNKCTSKVRSDTAKVDLKRLKTGNNWVTASPVNVDFQGAGKQLPGTVYVEILKLSSMRWNLQAGIGHYGGGGTTCADGKAATNVNNGDIINPGQCVAVQMLVKNTGTQDTDPAWGVYSEISLPANNNGKLTQQSEGNLTGPNAAANGYDNGCGKDFYGNDSPASCSGKYHWYSGWNQIKSGVSENNWFSFELDSSTPTDGSAGPLCFQNVAFNKSNKGNINGNFDITAPGSIRSPDNNYPGNGDFCLKVLNTNVPKDNPPTVSIINVDCSSKSAYITASDPDGTKFPVQYNADNGAGGPWTTANYTGTKIKIDLSSYDQYSVHTLYAMTQGVVPSGAQPAPAATATATYGPCLYRTFDITPTPNQPQLLNAAGQPDEEAPTQATFGGTATVAFTGPTPPPSAVKNINVTRHLYIQKLGGSKVNLDPQPNEPYDIDVAGTSFTVQNRNLSGLNPGDEVCMTITVNPKTGTMDNGGNVVTVTQGAFTTSPPVCTRIVTKPYFRAYGGDVVAGATCSVWNNSGLGVGGIYGFGDDKGHGASTEMAAFARDIINGFSGASARIGAGFPQPPKDLNFTNTAGDSTFGGGFGDSPCPLNYNGLSGSTIASGSTTLNGMNGINTYNGQLTIKPSTIPWKKKIVVYVDGDISITGPITYGADGSGNWQIDQIPSLTIIATGNIYIQPNVSQLEGVYIAGFTKTGKIYTCSNGFASWSGGSSVDRQHIVGTSAPACNSQLRVYGGFIAPEVELLRTIYSLKDSVVLPSETPANTKAAEVFVFDPEEWLTNSGLPSNLGGQADYDFVTSLSPLL
jgi:hypothetical protein